MYHQKSSSCTKSGKVFILKPQAISNAVNMIDYDTKRWVYFNATYRDPNLCFDKDTKSWVRYPTPRLFKNVTNLRHQELGTCATSSSYHHYLNRRTRGATNRTTLTIAKITIKEEYSGHNVKHSPRHFNTKLLHYTVHSI